jgi:hypothetical protein
VCRAEEKSIGKEQMDVTEGGTSRRIKIGEHSKREKEGVRMGEVQQHT